MERNNDQKPDIIDEDLYEEFDEEELLEIVEEARKEALIKSTMEDKKPKLPFPKWTFWLIAIAMLINVVAFFPKTFSIPAIDFLITSAKLSADDEIKAYKEAVVVVETQDSKGTGFAINQDGYILTNAHVVDDEKHVSVAFPNLGLYNADVLETYPDVDLALLKTESEEKLPYLELAEQTVFEENEKISFIGNPLAFNGIANQGTIIGYTQLTSWNLPVLMIDAPVYRGNSGSPIINERGQVIGVVFATLNHTEHGKVGLFVPIDYYYSEGVNLHLPY
ncbi:trypsin-like peptidase domain-containing protein [Ornithinibacillus sp. BX22]|uniref:Trypsin-like peptidase domain-containing protein n=1 Tax=Ornithinibacillus hominis TaxID=2763055 RepID=A0A923L534_9BACI|nr:serine protease [Ornithinibacillus hominis]MBC5636571.1 trypsin-like peptidase domain-containing protein [Ornithinibacillus hominis]